MKSIESNCCKSSTEMRVMKKTSYFLLKYTSFLGLTILISLLLKLVYPVSPDTFGKWSWITGFPLLRTKQLMYSYILTFIFFINIIILIYYELKLVKRAKNNIDAENNALNIENSENDESYLLQDLISFTNKINFGYLFKNLFPIIALHFVFLPIRKYIYHSTDFRISGHYLISLLSVYMISNMKIIINHLKEEKVLLCNINHTKIKILYIYDSILDFILLHHFYTLVFTCWIYHSIPEAISGFSLAVFCNYILFKFEVEDYVLRSYLLNNYINDCNEDEINNKEDYNSNFYKNISNEDNNNDDYLNENDYESKDQEIIFDEGFNYKRV